jgi:3-methyl-2-oxobutanoate hydroxymethyltransferase
MGSRVTPDALLAMKQRGEPIAMLTCYDYPTALQQEAADVDIIFIGDSVGINILGYEGPQQVTMEDMLHHTRAVRRGVKKALLVSDMPYGAYATPDQAARNALRLAGAGAEAVKLEGGQEVIGCVSRILAQGIPVIGHVGHTPQSREGGRAVFGDRAEEALAVFESARALTDAGIIAIVLECIPERVAEIITKALSVPTIGIGSGRSCDGQVLVAPDMLGWNRTPYRFVKYYADLAAVTRKAFSDYVADVKARRFPSDEHRFRIKGEELQKFKEWVDKIRS